MLNRREVLLAFGAIALSHPVLAQQLPTASDDEFQKFRKYLDFTSGRLAQDYAISTPNRIDEAKYLKLGGIEQWVTIRGEDHTNPVVLLLHGGPGDATNPWGYAGFRAWLKSFTVVQWDQRGAGRTLSRNGPTSAANLSLDLLVKDGLELAETVRTSLGGHKIILVGHSAGSVLGVLMAKAKPELFQAFVGTGQVGDPARALNVAFDALVAKAHALHETRAIEELKEIGPPPYKSGKGYQVQRRWANLFEGADTFIASMAGFALNAHGYEMPREFNDWLDGMVLSADRLVPELIAVKASQLTGRFALPVFVIQGAEDFTTPTSLAKQFVDGVIAHRKTFVTIRGGHFAAFMNSSEFLNELGRLVVTLR